MVRKVYTVFLLFQKGRVYAARLVRLLKATKEQLESFIEHSADAIVILGIDQKVQQVNPSFEEMYGWKEAELIGKRLPIIPESKRRGTSEVFEKVAHGKSLPGGETTALHKDGSIRHVIITISPIKDEQENTVGFSVVSLDITEKKKQEEALRKSEAKYRYITDNTSDLIIDSKKAIGT